MNISAYTLAISGKNLFAGDPNNGLFRSTDNGANWSEMNSGLNTHYSPSIRSLAISGTNVFVGTYAQGVFASNNNGTTWTAANYTLENASVKSLAISGTYIFAGVYPITEFGTTHTGSLFRSSNNGVDWTIVNNGLTDTLVYSLAVFGSKLFAGTYHGGIFYSSDYGTNWSAVNTGLTDTFVTSLSVIGTNLFAGTFGHGVWRRPLSEMTNPASVTEPLPITNEIHSYPNPLSGSTTINFSSEAAGFADVVIVNLLGDQVAHLFSGTLEAGEHNIKWSNTSSLPNGVYHCLIRINGQLKKQSLVLMR